MLNWKWFWAKKQNVLLIIPIYIITFFFIFYTLHIWSNLIIPFIIALLFSFAIIWLSNFYRRYKIPWFLSFLLSIFSYWLIFWLIWKIVNSNLDSLIVLLPEYQEKIVNIYSSVFESLNINEPQSLSQLIQWFNLTDIFSTTLKAITNIFSKAWIILIYIIFILLEYRFFWTKLNLMFSSEENKKHVFEVINKIKNDIKSYFVIKTVVSLITSLSSYLVMISFGLDFAPFWAFVIFILNYIPSIWSIIAVIFPILFSLIQFDNYYIVLFMLLWLSWVQVLMWNIIEPRFMWNKLNLSPIVILLSLWFWWSLWWVVGMLLSVPLMVIINIILAEIPATRSIAIFLSERWELQIHWEEVGVNRKNLIKKVKNKLKVK